MATVVVGDQIAGARLLTLRAAFGLELKGLSRRGRSVYSIVKQEFGLRGNKQRVYDQFDALVTERTGVARHA
jgi:hypothetical protein